MKRSLTVVLGTTLAGVVLGASPATAQQLTVSDPQGDSSSGIDLLGVTVSNADHAVSAELTVEDATRRGDLVVSADPRGGTGARMIAEFRPTGHSRVYLVRKAFTDRGAGRNERIACHGLRLSQGQSPAGPTITLRMPSTCLHDGDFGALRFGVLVEDAGGGDGDWAPEDKHGELGSTDWVARG